MLYRRISPFIVLIASLTACGDDTTDRAVPCETRAECQPGELCVEGLCEYQVVDPGYEDSDFDGILDTWESAADMLDTDGDGTPDYLDEDSDDDGIPDEVEGAGSTITIPPVDTDADGTPDYLDTDSDDNGILDGDEAEGDLDGDGIVDRLDTDDDNDLAPDVSEIGDDASNPVDFDGDGTPDFQDTDSDNDTIGDSAEGAITDTDGDGVPDRFDEDSDNDGILDSVEAGDADVSTPPVDTDGDMRPDFQDIDSDADGLSDAREIELGTSPTSDDTDGDGVPDLVEIAACFDEDCADDATNADSSPRTRGDFVFIEPYEQVQDPERDTLAFETNIQTADVYFLMDTTGSMGSSITSLRSSISDFITDVRDVIPNVWVGIGDYRDYPAGSYGSSGDFVFKNWQSLTSDTAAAQSATSNYTPGGGADAPESLLPALWTAVTGSIPPGTSGVARAPNCGEGFFGYPCFREGAVPIIIGITDQVTHNSYLYADVTNNHYDDTIIGGHTPTFEETIIAMRDQQARFIGIGQGSTGEDDLKLIARATRTTDSMNNPYYSLWSSGAIGDTVLNAVADLASGTRLSVSITFEDDDTDSVDTFAAFVQHLEANDVGDTDLGCDPRGASDSDGDGILDTFPDVPTDTFVCFDVVTKQNDTVEATDEPQIFRATLRVIGDGFTELDSREVIFLVPPDLDLVIG